MKLTIIKWRDIPTQVMIKKSRKEVEKAMLSARFMEAVDTAAMVGGAADTDAYLNDWHNEVIDIPDGDMQAAVVAKVEQLESEFTQEILSAMIQNSGYNNE
ncbi:virulence factor [Ostreibacterium oceani]|uniref:Virulence factor domain-containing protein n=1 Tax=Ostreibacterium oceani TaxID=2654998 RepID=A0A6N7F3L4_9GAMM|nr:virulence factor [Ostreibacterium oceani]MPV86466.1 hypothetical protein [Ostreibacterium oceani]